MYSIVPKLFNSTVKIHIIHIFTGFMSSFGYFHDLNLKLWKIFIFIRYILYSISKLKICKIKPMSLYCNKIKKKNDKNK